MKKQSRLNHHVREIKISEATANQLVAMYGLNNEFKLCANFLETQKIVTKIYKYGNDSTIVKNIQCKIKKTRKIYYFAENIVLKQLPSQFVFVFKFETEALVG